MELCRPRKRPFWLSDASDSTASAKPYPLAPASLSSKHPQSRRFRDIRHTVNTEAFHFLRPPDGQRISTRST